MGKHPDRRHEKHMSDSRFCLFGRVWQRPHHVQIRLAHNFLTDQNHGIPRMVLPLGSLRAVWSFRLQVSRCFSFILYNGSFFSPFATRARRAIDLALSQPVWGSTARRTPPLYSDSGAFWDRSCGDGLLTLHGVNDRRFYSLTYVCFHKLIDLRPRTVSVPITNIKSHCPVSATSSGLIDGGDRQQPTRRSLGRSRNPRSSSPSPDHGKQVVASQSVSSDQEAADIIKLLSKTAVEMNLVSVVDELSRTQALGNSYLPDPLQNIPEARLVVLPKVDLLLLFNYTR